MAQEYRVVGPPGTGKTTRLALLARQAANRYGGERVVICSLTRAAAAEVAGRDTPIPRENIGTLHSFAYHALGKPELADTPKGLKRWNEWIEEQGYPEYRITAGGRDVDEDSGESTWIGETLGDRCHQAIGVARSRLQSIEELQLSVQGFWAWWQKFRAEFDLLDFHGLLEEAWATVPTCPGDPAVLLADEAQDFSLLAMRLLRKWGEAADHFVIVGDPLQNLFAWAGTSPEAFTNPPLPPERQEILSRSYRVPRQVHATALRWVADLKEEVEAQLGKEIEYHPRDAEGEVVWASSAYYKYPEPAVRMAEEHLAEGQTVMFLTSCSHMLEPILAVLRKQGLPFHNPWRIKRGDWNPLARRKGTSSADRVLAFLRLSEEAWGDEARMWTPRELWAWVEVTEAKGVFPRGGKEAIRQAAQATFGIDEEMEPDMLFEWMEPEAAYNAMETAQNGSLDWWEDRLLDTKIRPLSFPIAVVRNQGAQALRERPRIIVGTIHSLKGSEADCCFLFPDLSQAGMDEWCRGGEGRDGIIRMIYVGMTRPREILVLCGQSSPLAVPWSLAA
jgi:DNA helicase II / ATP-dependent DNA helicase PcrA